MLEHIIGGKLIKSHVTFKIPMWIDKFKLSSIFLRMWKLNYL